MKFTVEKKEFNVAMAGAIRCTKSSKSTTLPIVKCCVITANEDGINIKATNLDLRTSFDCDAQVSEVGVVAVPAQMLARICNSSKSDIIYFETYNENHLKVTCGKSTFTLLGQNASDYPESDDSEEKIVGSIKVASDDIIEAISRVSFCSGFDDSRQVLHGINMSIKDNVLNFHATDGKCLAVSTCSKFKANGTINVILPKLFDTVLSSICITDDITINIYENKVSIIGDGYEASISTIKGNYPNVERVIPVGCDMVFELDIEKLCESLDLVLNISDENEPRLSFRFIDGQIEVNANGKSTGYGVDYCPCVKSTDQVTKDYTVTLSKKIVSPIFNKNKQCYGKLLFNPQKILETNSNLTYQDAFIFEADDSARYIIMPMRDK